MTTLPSWQNFYVIVGTSAGALIGLQFVVIALISDLPARRNADAGAAFATPTVIHFCFALSLAAALSAPWQGIGAPAVVWGVLGLLGIVYQLIVVRRIRAQKAYTPEFEDWLFHVVLPFVAYATLAGSACASRWNAAGSLLAVAAAAMLLVFIGIHNAWDAVTYHVFSAKPEDKTE